MLGAITGFVLCFMLYVGANDLEEVLGTLVQGAIAFPDPMVRMSSVTNSKMIIFEYFLGSKIVLWSSSSSH